MQEYYAYPFPYDDEDGDQVVRAYLHRNWKSYLGVERSRLVDKVKQLLECGYTEKDFNITDEGLKPYYYSQRTWNSMCDYWEDESFKNMSTNSQIARSKEINEEREARGELPISEDEFMGMVYDPTQPVVQNLQEKIKKMRVELAPEFELLEEPTSPRSLKEFNQKKEVIVLARARSPRKGSNRDK
ncbi:hypothetical protein AgCh_016758 [Apium graveolens]